MIASLSSPPTKWDWYYDVLIASDYQAARSVIEEILSHLDTPQWDDHSRFGIHLTLEEAIVNAIKHGNCESPGKEVRIRCGISEEYFCAEIEDEGEGFNPQALPDPTSDQYVCCPNGRGVLLMKNLMTQVEYNDRGNKVLLVKHNPVFEV